MDSEDILEAVGQTEHCSSNGSSVIGPIHQVSEVISKVEEESNYMFSVSIESISNSSIHIGFESFSPMSVSGLSHRRLVSAIFHDWFGDENVDIIFKSSHIEVIRPKRLANNNNNNNTDSLFRIDIQSEPDGRIKEKWVEAHLTTDSEAICHNLGTIRLKKLIMNNQIYCPFCGKFSCLSMVSRTIYSDCNKGKTYIYPHEKSVPWTANPKELQNMISRIADTQNS